MTITGLDTFAAVVLWMTPFVAGRHLRLGASVGRRSFLSVAGGISVAYVFVDLLPQMSQMQETFRGAASGLSLPFLDHRVYLSALIGFIAFHVLENMIVVSGPRRSIKPSDESFVSWLHIIGFAIYAALMGYLLVIETARAERSLALYGLAMFFHFFVVDHSLRTEHSGFYDHVGRWVIAAAVLAGWTIGLTGLSSEVFVPTLMGFVAGGVVINSIKEELPEKGEGRVLPFVLGTFGYALLLLLMETTRGRHEF